jgi:hypothetical protein
VAGSVDTISISATKADSDAVMSAFGSVIAPAGVSTGRVTVPLVLGTTTPIPIILIAPNGSQKTYTTNVTRPFR